MNSQSNNKSYLYSEMFSPEEEVESDRCYIRISKSFKATYFMILFM